MINMVIHVVLQYIQAPKGLAIQALNLSIGLGVNPASIISSGKSAQ